MRVHGESPEGNYRFWEVVFQGITKLDRKITFNLHAKGTSQRMIDMAEATKMPVSLSPKSIYEVNGRQFVVIACGGDRDPTTPKKGGIYVAFALPK